MTEQPTVEEYARNYVDVLNGPANGWGNHICKKMGMISDVVYCKGREQYGQAFDDACNALWRKEDP